MSYRRWVVALALALAAGCLLTLPLRAGDISLDDPDKPAVKHAGKQPATQGGKLMQPGTQGSIIRSHAAIPHRGPVCADHLARPALAHLE